MKHEQTIAGLRCSAVLDQLTEYVAGGLAEERRQAIESHVKQCERCERFGRSFVHVIRALRATEPGIQQQEARGAFDAFDAFEAQLMPRLK